MVLLVSDLQELTANPERPAIGTIVEAELDKARGAVATALVQTGTLNVGDIIVVGETFGRVRALENDRGKRVKTAGPASAVVVLGLSEVPAGRRHLRVVATTRPRARRSSSARPSSPRRVATAVVVPRSRTYTARSRQARPRSCGSSSSRTCRGRSARSPMRSNSSTRTRFGSTSSTRRAGDITDNDIMLAAASNAIVVGFSTSITDTARRASEAEGVDVRLYDIIYKLTDDIDAALKGLLEPEEVEVVEGRAEVRQVIRVGKNTVIAGSYVTDGRIVRGGARVWRGGKVIATDRIESLRRFRDDVREVQTNYECGIGLANFPTSRKATSSSAYSTQTVSRVAAG